MKVSLPESVKFELLESIHMIQNSIDTLMMIYNNIESTMCHKECAVTLHVLKRELCCLQLESKRLTSLLHDV